jgi:hypothetical protein
LGGNGNAICIVATVEDEFFVVEFVEWVEEEDAADDFARGPE